MPRDWPAFERLGALLLGAAFRFAKTMPHNPHFYTLRKTWERSEDFDVAVATLRAQGYDAPFRGRLYRQIDVNDHFYWTMGAPIPETILINRKPIESPAPYDAIADWYADAFTDAESLDENARVFDLVRAEPGMRVLDVGCGTGLALDYLPADVDYLGIDPSAGMLARLLARYEGATVVRSSLGAFVDPRGAQGRYDRVLALYGVGSYLSDDELRRIPLLLKPGGVASVMFFGDEYSPVTHAATGLAIPYRPFGRLPFAAWEARRIGPHVLATVRA